MHILRTQCIGGKGTHHCRIHSARQSQHRLGLAVLGKVVSYTHHQCLIHQFYGLGFLVHALLHQLKVNTLGMRLEIGELAQHRPCRVQRHRPSGIQETPLAAGTVHKHQRRIQIFHNLVHAVAYAVGLVVVEHVAPAAHHHIGLLHMRLRQLFQVLIETYGYLLFLVLYHLHTLATHKIFLLVGGQVLLGNDAAYGAVLHKHNCVAQSLVLYLQWQSDKESPVFRPLYQLLQHQLGAFLQIGVCHRPEQRSPTQSAGRKNGEQRLLAFRTFQLFNYPFQVFLGVVRNNIMLYNMNIHFLIELLRLAAYHPAPGAPWLCMWYPAAYGTRRFRSASPWPGHRATAIAAIRCIYHCRSAILFYFTSKNLLQKYKKMSTFTFFLYLCSYQTTKNKVKNNV